MLPWVPIASGGRAVVCGPLPSTVTVGFPGDWITVPDLARPLPARRALRRPGELAPESAFGVGGQATLDGGVGDRASASTRRLSCLLVGSMIRANTNSPDLHSGIGMHTPASVHFGTAQQIHAQRQATLNHAYAAHPERFTRRPRPPKLPEVAWINQPIEHPQPAP